MALQGTLDTFALPDVLRLLASTKKTGRLVIQGVGGNGSLWLDDGAVVGGEVSTTSADGPNDVLFELLRIEDGSFLFDPDDLAGAPGDATDVEGLIASAQQQYDEWRELSQVIPSLDAGVGLVDELPGDESVIDRERWRLVVGVGSGTTVRELGARLGLGEMPVLRAVRGLIDDGLVELREEVRAPSTNGALPTLGDAPEASDLFGDGGGDDLLPEPLPDGGGTEVAADPFGEAAADQEVGGGESSAVTGTEQVSEAAPAAETKDEARLRQFLSSVRS